MSRVWPLSLSRRSRDAPFEISCSVRATCTPGDAARHAAPVVYVPSACLCDEQYRLALRAALLSRPAAATAPALAGGHRIWQYRAFHINGGLYRAGPGPARPGAAP